MVLMLGWKKYLDYEERLVLGIIFICTNVAIFLYKISQVDDQWIYIELYKKNFSLKTINSLNPVWINKLLKSMKTNGIVTKTYMLPLNLMLKTMWYIKWIYNI